MRGGLAAGVSQPNLTTRAQNGVVSRIPRLARLAFFVSTLSVLGAAVSHTTAHQFEGYYFPSEPVVGAGYQLKWIAIERDRVWLRLVKQSNEDDFTSHDCPLPLVSADTLRLHCPRTPLGTLDVNGTFLDKRGNFGDRQDIDPDRTVVLTAVLTFPGFQQRVSFTWFGGD
jgi:hypothetical protein